MYFNRGEYAALALCEDLFVDDDFLTLRLRFEKRSISSIMLKNGFMMCAVADQM